MQDPFRIHTDEVRDRSLKDIAAKRWVEDMSPGATGEIAYLKPSLRLRHLRIAAIICFSVLTLLLARSAQLQIMETSAYRNTAQSNRLRMEYVPAPRGIITDRGGTPLVRNVPSFRLMLNPLDLPPKNGQERQRYLERLAESAGMETAALTLRIDKMGLPVSPLVLKRALTLEEAYPLIISTQDIPGVSIESASVREYIYGDSLAHLLGYVGSIDKQDEEKYRAQGYTLTDEVGKAGLELTLEPQLRGNAGRRYVEVDARGDILSIAALEKPAAGQGAALTIDYPLQQSVYDILRRALDATKKDSGAVVVIDPKDGAVLAMISYPSFDNNVFTSRRDQNEAAKLLTDPANPLFPRAIAGLYPSGSTIKPAIAAAALDAGVINRATGYISTGGLRISQWFFPDWKAGGHGLTNVRKAIAESVNTFFYIIGGGYNNLRGLGIETLADYLTRFGFGFKTGIEIGGEADGLVPTPKWKETVKGEPWYVGDTYHLAIGQGDILVTPLQIARMTAYFASGGRWTAPHLVDNKSLALSRATKLSFGPGIAPQHIQTVREGLRDAVRYGSARALQALPEESAGKTGTAQWSSKNDPHAWFTGWVPYDDPEIVVTVLVEQGGEGSRTAVPIAKEIMQWWINNRM